MTSKLGIWLFNLACRLNPAIPLAMQQVAEQHGLHIAQAIAQQQAVAQALAAHQQEAAARAARQ